MCSVSIGRHPSTCHAAYSSSLRTSRSRKGAPASACSSSRSTVVVCSAFIGCFLGAVGSFASQGTASDEERDTRACSFSHKRRDLAQLNPVEKLIFVNPHDVHGHGAADHPHAKFARQLH